MDIEPAVRIDHVSKCFSISGPAGTGGLFTGVKTRLGRGPEWSREGSTLWALQDVSLDIMPGQAVGVIGRNGSGKSTLMRIVAGVTRPTEGLVSTRGRIGAMLRAGTGFHPDLSGRDNIALSGAVLGMSKAEIAAVFDRIVDFAEVRRFLDTPVKRYSSGMGVRLAFSVSAHMPAEILIIDEVLSVGDANFQKKSFERIREMVDEGRTILFVTHSMSSIRDLCSHAMVIDQGTLRFAGDANEAVDFYEGQILQRRGLGTGHARRKQAVIA